MRATFALSLLAAAVPVIASGAEHSRFAKRAAAKCPAGYKFQTIKDDFKGPKISPVWNLDVGSYQNLQFQKGGGLRIRISKKSDNVVFSSKVKFLPGSTFVVDFKPPNVPGVVTPFIFKGGDGSDEVDLELIGKEPESIQSVVWHKAREPIRVQFNTTGFALPGNKTLNTQKSFNKYQLTWKADSVKLWVNGDVLRTHKREKNQLWALDPLNFKFGPWVSDTPGWAGKLDWKKHPTADLYIKSIAVAGCAK